MDHYVVQRKAPGESVFSDLNTNVTASSGGQNADPELSHAANQFTFTDATQTVAGTYTYRVKAVHVANGADAVWSSEVAVAVTLSGIAANDSYTVNEDTPLVVAAVSGVLANDDTSGGALSVVSTDTLPSNGTLTGNAVNTDGSFTYTPNANFNGTDQFTYTATNGTDTDSATVTITVNAVNDPPVAVGGGGNVDEDNTLSASVPAASDVDLDPLTYVQDTGPTHAATFTLNTDGSFSYTPAANYNGPDSFTFHANDGTADSNTVTYNITVNSVNDQPLALITNEGSTFSGSAPFSLNLSGVNSTDVEDGTPPTFLWDFGDGSGDTVMDPPAHLYAAPGVYTVSLIVTDSQSLASVPVTAQVTVSGGAGDGDLYAKRGLFTINWKAHNGGNDAADLITLSGNFNLNGVPADLTGVSVRLDINGTQLGTSQTLDAAGRFTSARTAAPNYRYLLRSNRGTYSVRVSKTDLRSFIPGFNSTIAESGQVLVEVRLLLSGGGLAAPVDVSNFLRFDYTTRANLNTRGRFIFTRHDSLNGAFLSRRTIATEPRSGGGHVISARGFIAPAGGGPLLPMDDPNAIVVTVGTLAPITIPFAALNVRGLTPERSSYTYSRTLLPIPALKRFQINNARRSFVLTTALGDAGIPLSDDLVSTSHVLSIQVDVLTASGTFTFTTQVELLRNLLRLKRWLR